MATKKNVEPVLLGFVDGIGAVEARFADGRTVQIHAGSGRHLRRFYVMLPGERRFTGAPELSLVDALPYQRAAIAGFLSGAEHAARRDDDGILVVDVP